MSYTFIENQPIIFSKEPKPEYFEGRGEFDYSQLISRENDITYVQMKISPIEIETNIISSPDITDVTKWLVTGSGVKTMGLITIGGGSSGDAEADLINDPFPNPSGRYQVEIDVQTIFGTANIVSGSDIVGTINSSGTQTLTFFFSGTISISIADSTSYIEITGMRLKRMPQFYLFAITDLNGNIVKILNSDRDASCFYFQKDRLTIQIEWGAGSPDFASIPDGCYYISIADPEDNPCNQFSFFNGDFVNRNNDEAGKIYIDGWSSVAPMITVPYFFPGPYRAVITAEDGLTPPGIRNTITQLCAGKEYEITFHGTEVTGHTATVKLICGGTTQTISVSSDTTYTVNITPGTNDYLRITVDNSSAPGYDVSVEIYEIFCFLVNDWDYSFPINSELPLKIQDNWDDTINVLIYNNEDGIGFVFQDNIFQPNIRVFANIINRSYEIQREQEDDDAGVRRNQYGEVRKNRFLRIEHQPNIVHDFLSIGVIADYFYVYYSLGPGLGESNLKAYVIKNDSYEPDYSDNLDNMATVELEIGETVQLVRNVNSGNLNPLV